MRLPAQVSVRVAAVGRRMRLLAFGGGLRLDAPELTAEMRQLMSVGARRDARDRHGMRVIIAAAVGREDSAIDVGAHSGAVLAEIVRVAPEGRHIAYEPLPAFAVIKIDVEGAELLVMRGATSILRRDRPVVVFEHAIGASDRYGSRSEDVHDLLVGELDMRIFDLDGEGPYARGRFVDVFPEPIWNFVALPR